MALTKRVHNRTVVQTPQVAHTVSQKTHNVLGRVLPVEQTLALQRIQRKQQSAGSAGSAGSTEHTGKTAPAGKRKNIGGSCTAKMPGIGLCH